MTPAELGCSSLEGVDGYPEGATTLLAMLRGMGDTLQVRGRGRAWAGARGRGRATLLAMLRGMGDTLQVRGRGRTWAGARGRGRATLPALLPGMGEALQVVDF